MEIRISGVNVAPYYVPHSLKINHEVNKRSTCRFQLADASGELHLTSGEPVEIYDAQGEKIFGGLVEQPEEEIPLGSDVIKIPVTCVDYQALADRWLVAESYENRTCGFMVRDLLDKKLAQDGVTEGNIQEGPEATRVVFPYISLADAMDELAELAGFSWWITPDKKLHFVSRNTYPSPWIIDESSPIRKVKVRVNKKRYRNRQYIRAGQDVTDVQTEIFKGDGAVRTFTVGYKLAEEPQILVNGTPVASSEIGIRGKDEGKRWYWAKNEKEITQDKDFPPLTASDELRVEYKGYFPILVVAEDGQAIENRIQTEGGGSGIYEKLDEHQAIDDSASALDLAKAKLRKFARINRELSFETDRAGLKAGQILHVHLPSHRIEQREYLIDTIAISEYSPDGGLRYQVHAVDGEPVGGWSVLFQTMQKQGVSYSIRENEVLVKLKSTHERTQASDVFVHAKAAPETRIGYLSIGFGEVG